ncbi:hypothetical protein BOQ63_002175 (plasmid) [Streptomyces viridifaciens]|nr:hypothetical protein BOQ63_002175 [Streptomyces viridifaciens]
MVNVAGIGVARLGCHKDTWAYFTDALAKDSRSHGAGQAFRSPAAQDITDEGNGMVAVPLGQRAGGAAQLLSRFAGAVGNWSVRR